MISLQTRLYILDCFFLEGIKVLFRFSIALLEMNKENVTRALAGEMDRSTGETINIIRGKTVNCFDVLELKRIAFGQVKIPRRKHLATRRAFYVKQLNGLALTNSRSTGSETTAQWIRRRSSELLGLSQPFLDKSPKIVLSADKTKIAICRFAEGDSVSSSAREAEIFSCYPNETSCKTFSTLLAQPPRGLTLYGVADDGSKLVFCQHGNRMQSTNNNGMNGRDGVQLEVLVLPYELVDGFYLESSNHFLAVGKNGVISKVNLTRQKSRERTVSIYEQPETTHLGKQCKILAAACDQMSGFLWVHFVETQSESDSSPEQLFVIDTLSLDVFICIDLGQEPITRMIPSSGIIFVARQRNGNSVISLTTPHFSRQLFAESDQEEGIRDLQSFTCHQPNQQQHNKERSFDKQCAKGTIIVVALFNSGKLTCIETSGYCLHSKRTSHMLSREQAANSLVVNVISYEHEFHVTVLNTAANCTEDNKLSLIKVVG